ncbi:ubiquinol-cytochrome c reductase iron-sulfur subunit [Agromyces sp. S2-1-8]|uniref:QcrA and Rieske domain-containing protein n=1 Tax=Agromyces sp. S2-1-8 TaxID=2897180 RepID=UPI001E45D773|nr:Rieske (2Fe-2S) protein [Agromyces sp. S2-1-8]MCD5346946.1 Rieske (2Fe-2S) protein [Agromyces sp. S2-1-8]
MTASHDLTRRAALTFGTAGALALAGCADVSGDGSNDDANSSPIAPDDTASAEPPAAGEAVAATADVPVGGSIDAKLGSDPVLVAQPSEGEFVAYSAICTHQQCVVAAAGAEFHCPCHGSIYDAATGEVLAGPAPEPLSPIAVTVAGDQVVTAS